LRFVVVPARAASGRAVVVAVVAVVVPIPVAVAIPVALGPLIPVVAVVAVASAAAGSVIVVAVVSGHGGARLGGRRRDRVNCLGVCILRATEFSGGANL
jgi:hypothetical protein